MMLDVSTSDTGTDSSGAQNPPPASVGLPPETDPFTTEGAAALLAGASGKFHFYDSLSICRLTLYGTAPEHLTDLLKSVTGWEFNDEEIWRFGRRVTHLLRVFNVRHGLTPELEAPSSRYASVALSEEGKGKTFLPVFEQARQSYYQNLGWDLETGRPLPETLKNFELDYLIDDIW